jgi:hypothetical protein
MGKPEEKTPLGTPRHGWDSIKMYLQQVGLVGWTGLIWPRSGIRGGLL